MSKRDPEESAPSKRSDADRNPFIAFRRALDAQISSVFRTIVPSSSAFEGSLSHDTKDLNKSDDVFDEFSKRWDRFMEDTRREASKFYKSENVSSTLVPGTNTAIAKDKSDPEKLNPSTTWLSRLGFDGKKRMEAQRELTPENEFSGSGTDEWHSWTKALEKLRHQFHEIPSAEKSSSVLEILEDRDHILDFGDINDPSTVPFLLHNPYSPINIPSLAYSGTQTTPYEEAQLSKHPFKEAFEDLMRLHNSRRMVQSSETYASQRNPSGHPMHWVGRLIEAGVLGKGWSIWGNGGTRNGLWFLNSITRTSINATEHSRFVGMPHIPYQGYMMQKDWFGFGDSPNFPIQVQAAISVYNNVSSFAASSAITQSSESRVRHYEKELQGLQWAGERLLEARLELRKTTPQEDALIVDLLEDKVVEINDRCTNLSEYLLSKSLDLDKSWWYGGDHPELFESGEYFGNSFSGIPFIADAFDKFEFSVQQMRLVNDYLKISSDVEPARRIMAETFVDLHRSKKHVEEAFKSVNSDYVAANPLVKVFPMGQCMELYRSIVEMLETMKSQFVSEGQWDKLSDSWEPGPRSDYQFQDTEPIRSDCYPRDPNASIRLGIPRGFRPLYSALDNRKSKGNSFVLNPEISYPREGIDQLYEYLNRAHYYNDLLTGARSILLRENPRHFPRSCRNLAEGTVRGMAQDTFGGSTLLHGLFPFSEDEIVESDGWDPKYMKDVICKDLGEELDLLQKAFSTEDDSQTDSEEFKAHGSLTEEDGLEQHNGEHGLWEEDDEDDEDDEDEEPPSGQRQPMQDPLRWPSGAEVAKEIRQGASGDHAQAPNVASSQWPKSFYMFDKRDSGAEDSATPRVVSTSSTVTTRTLPNGSIERRKVMQKKYADGNEETSETVDVSEPGQSAPASAPANQQGQVPVEEIDKRSEMPKEKRKRNWFWN